MFTPEMRYKRIPESILSANISWSHKFLTYDFRYGCYPSQLAWLLLHVCSSPNRTYLALLFNNWIMVWDLDRARVGILYRRITRSSSLCYDDPRSFPGTESNPIKLFRASYPLQIIKKRRIDRQCIGSWRGDLIVDRSVPSRPLTTVVLSDYPLYIDWLACAIVS